MKTYRITIDAHTYDVEVADPRARPIIARVDGEEFQVDIASPAAPGQAGQPGEASIAIRPPASTREPASSPADAEAVLVAPIPGTVVAVVVEPGATVQRGDELLTIEAMKMFNAIRSPRAGTIAQVHVAERARVAQGDPLVTFSS